MFTLFFSLYFLNHRERPSVEGGRGGITVGVHVLFSSDRGMSIMLFCLPTGVKTDVGVLDVIEFLYICCACT
jgi:hypothetical protein